MRTGIVFIVILSAVSAFPWVPDQPQVDSSLLKLRRQQPATGAGGQATCPFNPNHQGAAPYNSDYPYNHAQNGLPGQKLGGYKVPADGDTAHQFVAAGPLDIRGPCPGLNTLANHNFLSHDGITTFNELMDAQQNVFNIDYPLAALLAALGLTLTDGDPITQKLSIGCDATSRTSFNQLLTGSEPGLDGHNKFEMDTSLTRNDYFLANGDDFSFNGTLFGMMTETCNGNYNLENLSKYRLQRYQQSKADNGNFFFGPVGVLLYGAASFLYEVFPSGTNNYVPDFATISSFFGAKANAQGGYDYVGEKIPDNWVNRVAPFSNADVTTQILNMYLLNPVLFGGNTGQGTFQTTPDFGDIKDGKLVEGPNTACLIYQLATSSVPGYLGGVLNPTLAALNFIAQKVEPLFENLGCPNPLTK